MGMRETTRIEFSLVGLIVKEINQQKGSRRNAKPTPNPHIQSIKRKRNTGVLFIICRLCIHTHLEHVAQGELSFLEQFSLVYENTTQLLTIYTVQLTNTQQGQH